ncbi:conserved hypothetical protein [Xenorhabdus nematophila str. Anatoliense]|nr:conserved hypothetical protein [Xenorhabdus nematophila str. Anatoliense]
MVMFYIFAVYPRTYGEHSNFIHLFYKIILEHKNSTIFSANKSVKLSLLFFLNHYLQCRSHFTHIFHFGLSNSKTPITAIAK